MKARAMKTAALCVAALGCSPHRADSGVDAAPSADSIVLERTPCFGFCPSYRLSATRDGRVAFESRNPRESGRRASATIAPSVFARLVERANAIGFSSLPDTIRLDRALCPRWATDMPTAIVSIFMQDRVERVVDSHGCFPESDQSGAERLAQLRAFEASIDSATGASRWIVRPNR